MVDISGTSGYSTSTAIHQKVKIILVGDLCVGKTNLVHKFENPTLSLLHMSHQRMDSLETTIQLQDSPPEFLTAILYYGPGQERYYATAETFFRECHGFVIVFDVTRRETFQHVQFWLDQINSKVSLSLPRFLLGNMIDKKREREIFTEEGEEFAYVNDLIYLETSAFTGDNVQNAFRRIIIESFQKKKLLPKNPSHIIRSTKSKKRKKGSKCCLIF